jgi:hypothetical protein
LLRGKAVAVSGRTNIHALLLGGLSSHEGGRGVIGVARIKGPELSGKSAMESMATTVNDGPYISWLGPLI